MIRLVQRLAAIVAAALLVSTVVAAPAVAQPPAWSHQDQRVCGQPGPGQARCLAIARSFYRNGSPFLTGTRSALSSVTAADQVSYVWGSDMRAAYGIPSTELGDASKVVAIVDAYHDPDAYANLSHFRLQSQIAPIDSCSLDMLTSLTSSSTPCFTQVDQNGGTNLPTANAGWSNEIDLDVQAVSAMCPHCSILLLEASSASILDLGTAVTTASNTPHVVAISNSYSGSELFSSSYTAWNDAASKGIAVTASSGDSGYGVGFPATSTNVIGVGGTTLTVSGTGGPRTAETAWAGSGSGCSRWNKAPAWQSIPGNPCKGKKAVADVSADADPSSGLAVYTTYNSQTAYWVFGGTSLSSPLIAALYAMQGGYGGSTQAGQYAWASGTPYYDVTSGSNGSCNPSVLCTAGSGWDGPTGLGSIQATSTPPTSNPPVADFSGTPTSGDAPLTVSFTDLSTNSPNSWSWDFGDGGSSGAQNPSHIYQSAGSYTVSLIATNADGSGSVTKSGYITVTTPPTSTADFSLSVSPGRRNIKAGDTTTYTVTISPLNGFNGTVTLSLTSDPSGLPGTFDPSGATTSSTLTIPTTSSTPTGTYTLTITGTDASGTLIRTTTASLRIR